MQNNSRQDILPSAIKYEIICQKFFYLTVIYNCATLCGFKIFFGSNTLLIPFINSDTDNQLFDDNFQDIAQAIADGILDTLESNGLIQEEKVPVYRVQVGLFRNQRYANWLLNELLEQEYPAYIDRSGPYHRVYVGEFDNLNDAVQMERRLKRAGYQTLIVQ